MSEKQAKLKKATNIVFLIVTCVVFVWFLVSGFTDRRGLSVNLTMGMVFLSILTALSTLLYFQHIRFKRSIPFGIANLIALLFAFFCSLAFEILFLYLFFAIIYGTLSSIHFFSNKLTRISFPFCVISLSVLLFVFACSLCESNDFIIITTWMIVVYTICELLAYYFSSPWYCENCGNKNGDKHFFCTKCGGKNPYLK